MYIVLQLRLKDNVKKLTPSVHKGEKLDDRNVDACELCKTIEVNKRCYVSNYIFIKKNP